MPEMGTNTSSVLRQVSQEEREEQEYARLVDDVEAARRARLITPQNPLQEHLLNTVQTQNRVSALNGLPAHQHTSHTSPADANFLTKQSVTPLGFNPAQPSAFGECPAWTTLCLPLTESVSGNSHPLFLGRAPRQISDGSHTVVQSPDESAYRPGYIITSMCETCDIKPLILTQVAVRGENGENRADDGSGLRQLFLDDS